MASQSSRASSSGQRPSGPREHGSPVASQKTGSKRLEPRPTDERPAADRRTDAKATNQQEEEEEAAKASPVSLTLPQQSSTESQSVGPSEPLPPPSASSRKEGKETRYSQDIAKSPPTSPSYHNISENREIVSAAEQTGNDVNGNELVLGLLNAHSVKKQTPRQEAIKNVISTESIDVMAITETWHEASDIRPLRNCAPRGYRVLDAARPSRGGGVALLYADRFTGDKVTFNVRPTTFEMLGCSLRSESTSCIYVVIYRPNSKWKAFLDELELLLKIVVAFQGGFVICGDFNIHVNKPDDSHARLFRAKFERFGLVQLVNERTQRKGNTLDLVIVRRHCQTNCAVREPGAISDHSLITCRFSLSSLTAEDHALSVEDTGPWKLLHKVTRSL